MDPTTIKRTKKSVNIEEPLTDYAKGRKDLALEMILNMLYKAVRNAKNPWLDIDEINAEMLMELLKQYDMKRIEREVI